jgi:hypothetical protein
VAARPRKLAVGGRGSRRVRALVDRDPEDRAGRSPFSDDKDATIVIHAPTVGNGPHMRAHQKNKSEIFARNFCARTLKDHYEWPLLAVID